MLDPRRIRDDFETVQQGLLTRGVSATILESFMQADQAWRETLLEVEALQAKRNQLLPKGKPSEEQMVALKQLSDELKAKQELLAPLEAAVNHAALELPNVPHESTPVGASETDNVVVETVGTPPSFSFTPKAHHELGIQAGVLDFDSAVKITGARFVVYRKWGAKLERALIQLMLDQHTAQHGYEEIIPPVIVNSASLTGTGQLPKFADDLFRISDSDFWLSPTAEVQITNMYRDSILSEEDLPKCLTAYTPCFRKEAGSYGKDMTGLIRHHQFNKVELVQFVHPDRSMEQLELLLSHAKKILDLLELPYRVLSLCSGDIGFSSAKTYDLEVWFPSQNMYREISSCSNFLDFQSRRGMIRFRDKSSGKTRYVHTLNGSGLAVGRTFAAILENYQLENGTIVVPSVLRPYLGVNELK